MADSRATALQLSATELRTLTKWPDAVIYEFLSMEAGIRNITNNINIIINELTSTVTLEAQSTARISALTKTVQVLEDQLHAFDALPSQLADLRRDLLRTINNSHELLSGLNALITKVASNKRDQQRIINNLTEELTTAQARESRQAAKITTLSDQIAALTEQTAAPDYTMLPRLNRNADLLADLQQEVAGS